MKNRKFTLLLVSIISLALLVGSVVGISVSASDDGSVSILAQSIIHKDKISIAFAVDVPKTDVETAGVKAEYKIGDDGEWKSATLRSENYAVTVGDETVSYAVFATEGISAQDFVDTVYLVAYTGDTRPDAVKSYSVMEFLYNKLYVDGYATYTSGDKFDYAELYRSLVVYGANAQTVLVNHGKIANGETPETLITDYHCVYVKNGTVGDTGLSKIITTEDKVTLTYGEELAAGSVCTWNITYYDIDGSSVTTTAEEGAEVEVLGNMICSASIFVPTTYIKGNGKYYSGNYTGKVIDYDNGEGALSFKTGTLDPVGEILGDTDKYTYADFSSTTSTLNTTLTFNSPAASDKSFVMEFDAKFEDVDGTFGYIMLCDKINGGNVAGARSSIWFTGTDGNILLHKSNHTVVAGESISVKQGEWHNFRFEYQFDAEKSLILVKAYIDNEWQCDFYTNGSSTETSSSYRALIYVNSGNSTKLSLDNIYLGYSTEAVTITVSEQ